MKTIRCKNIYKDPETGKDRECGRILAALTDFQVDLLVMDDERPLFRCPKCPPEQRWIEIYYNKDTDKIGLNVLSTPPELKEDINCEEMTICQQVG
jgi:hypothetical protein